MNLYLKNIKLENKETYFENLSYTFKEGNIYFLEGKHGIGKSFLINALVGLSPPSQGDILYDDSNFYQDGRDQRHRIRKNMGVIFDCPGLLSNLSIFENLRLRFLALKDKNLFLELGSKKDLEMDDLIMDELRDIELDHKKNLRPHLLSRGQVKKVSISRAFLSAPKILIWDDAFEGLSQKDIVFYENKLLQLKSLGSLVICLNSTTLINKNNIDEIINLSDWRN